ncbi:hypothetical protein R1sor_017214 [Riccia sorocarpa]|uniref:MSP domain-containing protein n=1 Tax=Riccia sorocarpa TaxID=122646 RepID=A0ABD3IA75_9MARC
MDRLLEVKQAEVTIDFELRTKCRTRINMKNLMHTMPVAFKVQSTSPKMFSVRPPNGCIPPLGDFSLEVVLVPQDELPESFPCTRENFFIKSAMAPGGFATERIPAEWFSVRKKHVFLDAKLRVVFSGAFLLRHLVARGEIENVRFVIQRKSHPNKPDDQTGRTALHIAAMSGNVEMVELLLDAGAIVDVISKTGQTPLLEAVYMGHLDIVLSLLERGASPEARNSIGWTSIHLAALRNYVDIVRLLIERGALLEAPDREGRTALHSAVTAGHFDCVKVLLEAGADPDLRSVDGRTALYRAAAKGDSRLVELLLEWGAHKNVKAVDGKSPYDIAAEKGHAAVLSALRRGNGLMTAARRGNLEMVRRHLGRGAEVSDGDQYGWTALHCAAFNGHGEVVDELLAYGADVDCRDVEGHTPLHCAVEAGNKEVVQLLIGRGADVEAKSVRGTTPLNIAVLMKNAALLRFLLNSANGAFIQIVGASDGCTVPVEANSPRLIRWERQGRRNSLVCV